VWISSAVAASEALDEEAVIALGASELLERARELAARDK
jgi:hypothetical protein